jgi:hypothetical protein
LLFGARESFFNQSSTALRSAALNVRALGRQPTELGEQAFELLANRVRSRRTLSASHQSVAAVQLKLNQKIQLCRGEQTLADATMEEVPKVRIPFEVLFDCKSGKDGSPLISYLSRP